MSEVWNGLARKHGRVAAVNLDLTEGSLDELTAAQTAHLFPLLRSLLTGNERWGLDYGCGAGRFSGMVADLVSHHAIGYDPSGGMLALAPLHLRLDYISCPPRVFVDTHGPFDLIWCYLVLGNFHSHEEASETAGHLVSLLAPDGLLVLGEHEEENPHETWWKFRPTGYYRALFSVRGLSLNRVGEVAQLAHPVTIYAGRK